MLLTRAARKKAGLSPPPPLFGSASSSVGAAPTAMTPPAVLPQPAAPTGDSSSSSSGEEGEGEDCNSKTRLWVQCEHLSCRKWRPLRKDVQIDTDGAWYCSMHPDPSLRSCSIPEGKWKRPKRGYNFSTLNPGQLVWAKMRHFPPWPAIVTPDPWSDNNYTCKDKMGSIYHVEFLGRMRSHLWLTEEQVEPYHSGSSSLGLIDRKNAPLKAAILEADGLINVPDCEKLSDCKYTEPSGRGKASVADHRKCTKKKPKKTAEELKFSPENAADHVKPTKMHDFRTAKEFGTLEKLLAGSGFNLQEFLQTNFAVDGSGVLRLTNSPKGARKEPVKRKKKVTPVVVVDAKSNRNQSVTKRGRKPTAVWKRISPTIPDYFNSSVLPPKNTACTEKLPEEHQVVPNCIASAEAEALKELEDIESMLTIFEGNSPKPSVGDKCSEEGGGRSSVRKQDSVNSEWVESVLGDINEIEDLIQDLSQGEVMLY